MNIQSYTEMSIEFIESLIAARRDEMIELQQEIEIYEEDFTIDLQEEVKSIQKEIDDLTKILEEKESQC